MKIVELLENEDKDSKKMFDELYPGVSKTVDPNGIHVKGNLSLAGWEDENVYPPKISRVDGNFVCTPCHADLSYTPNHVAMKFTINDWHSATIHPCKSLENGPRRVSGVYNAQRTSITNLKGLGEECPSLDVSKCPYLTTIDDLPTAVRSINVSNTPISSIAAVKNQPSFFQIFATNMPNLPKTELANLPDKCAWIEIGNWGEGPMSFSGIHKMKRNWEVNVLTINGIATHLLGLVLIPGIKKLIINDPLIKNAAEIIMKHASNGRDVNECQEELIEAGFKDQAKL